MKLDLSIWFIVLNGEIISRCCCGIFCGSGITALLAFNLLSTEKLLS